MHGVSNPNVPIFLPGVCTLVLLIKRVLMFGGARVFWRRAYLLMIVAIIVAAVLLFLFLYNTISIKETTELYNLYPFIDYQSSL